MKKACGKLRENEISSQISELEAYSCGKLLGYPRKPGPACERQVFSSIQVAEETARAIKAQGIKATPFKCEYCGLVHLSEVRIDFRDNKGRSNGRNGHGR